MEDTVKLVTCGSYLVLSGDSQLCWDSRFYVTIELSLFCMGVLPYVFGEQFADRSVTSVSYLY